MHSIPMHLKSIDYPGGKAKHAVWERAEYYRQTCESDSIEIFERKDSTRHDGEIHTDREMKYLCRFPAEHTKYWCS